MFIDRPSEQIVINTRKYRLQIVYVEKVRKGNIHGAKILLTLNSKVNNMSAKILMAEISMGETQLKDIFRQFTKFRILHISSSLTKLTLSEKLSLLFKDITSESINNEVETTDILANSRAKYRKDSSSNSSMEILFTDREVWAKFFQKDCSLKVAEKLLFQNSQRGEIIQQLCQRQQQSLEKLKLKSEIKVLKQLKSEIQKVKSELKKMKTPFSVGKKEKGEQSQENNLRKIIRQKQKSLEQQEYNICHKYWKIQTSSNKLTIDWENCTLHTPYSIFPLPVLTLQQKSQQLTQKQQLFRHIFLTELITHMILNQFSKDRRKQSKYKDGRTNYQYQDQQLQTLRSCGHRFASFRDYSVEFVRPEQQYVSQNSSQSDKDKESHDDQIVEKKKKTEVQRIGKKIKNVLKKKNKESIINFIIVSGEDKSQINKMRYCLHQMTRQTDKTQALINFIQLVFSSFYPKDDLFPRKGESKAKKKVRMAYFLKQFKVKRSTTSCLREYSRESFFHKVLNIGLRVLKQPYQLTYLRLPFSHIFWSIKTLYHRYKRAIFSNSPENNSEKLNRLYRGCQLREEQILVIQKNIGGFIQMEGFLSTTMKEERALFFATNVLIEIEVITNNLKGLHDNGFAHLDKQSLYPKEKEVLVNAFNLFKILSCKKIERKKIEIWMLRMEYGGLKKIEDKIQKSENLLESECLMKIQEKKIQSAKHLLCMKEQNMSLKQVANLKKKLQAVEKKLMKWKQGLNKQQQSELKTAFDKLEKWEQEILISCTHQEEKLKNIDSYGHLLMELGNYSRGTAYYQRMVKQVERDKSIEGWQWRKTPFLPHREQSCRKLLARCYFMQSRFKKSQAELKKIQYLYQCMNIKKNQQQYIELLNEMKCIYKKLGFDIYHKQQQQCSSQLNKALSENNIKKSDELINIYDISDIWGKINKLSVQELEKKKKQQKERLKKISLQKQGQYSTTYLSELYILICLLNVEQIKRFQYKSQRNYDEVMAQCKKYLSIRKHASQIQNRSVTLSVFDTLLTFIKKQQQSFMCKKLKQFLSFHMYDVEELRILSRFIFSCVGEGSWMTAKQAFLKIIEIQNIQYILSTYEYCRMMIFFMMGYIICGDNNQYIAWMRKAQKQAYDQYKQWSEKFSQPIIARKKDENDRCSQYSYFEKKLIEKYSMEFLSFPHSIALMEDPQKFECIFEKIKWFDYQDVIKICLERQQYLNNKQYRQYQLLESAIWKSIKIYHLQSWITKPRESQLKRLFGEGKQEVMVWQQPCDVRDRVYGKYGVWKFLVQEEVMMVILYLQHPQYHYLRALSTISCLHLPPEGCSQLISIIQTDCQQMGKPKPSLSKNLKSRHRYLYDKNWQKRNQAMNKNREKDKKQRVTIVEQSRLSSSLQGKQLRNHELRVWKQTQQSLEVKMQLLSMQVELIPTSLASFQEIKRYCKLMISDGTGIPFQNICLCWDSHQKALANNCLNTVQKLHLKSPLRPVEQAQAEVSSLSLTQLMDEQIVNQISSLNQNQYLIRSMKALISQYSVPNELMRALFSDTLIKNACKRLAQLLMSKQEWKEQLKKKLSQHSIQSIQSLLQQQNMQLLFYSLKMHLQYWQVEQSEQIWPQYREKECLRYAVMKVLVDIQDLNSHFLQLLYPVVNYFSIDEEDDQKKSNYHYFYSQIDQQGKQHNYIYYYSIKDIRQKGYYSLVKALIETKSCLHDGWATPMWWFFPNY